MTQKGNLFKGKQNKKVTPANRHRKAVHIRKGKRVVKPSKITKDMDTDRHDLDQAIVILLRYSGLFAEVDFTILNFWRPLSLELRFPIGAFFFRVFLSGYCEEFLVQIWWMGLSFIILLSAFWTSKELTKFINHCNEVKAATIANKEGGQLSIVETSAGSTANKKDEKPDSN
ncbi:hypothetical protein Pint_23899 [Pistacia integerrima]|uniref:Uncharacterized protein n=1 Tax=Pistacia integerrima TaxID=434235 RepID=A0ACC0YL44_9ROSI|nr:hypothetical protein Pint_23899 [Pistacia integerrima]